MKKTLITSAIALSALTFAFADDATNTPPALPPVVTTGSSTLDAQIKALRQEMEAKIKAVRDEYQVKLKAIIGERKAERKGDRPNASSTIKEIRKEIKDERKDFMEDRRNERDRREQRVEGASTTAPRFESQKLMNFFRSLFGGQRN